MTRTSCWPASPGVRVFPASAQVQVLENKHVPDNLLIGVQADFDGKIRFGIVRQANAQDTYVADNNVQRQTIVDPAL